MKTSKTRGSRVGRGSRRGSQRDPLRARGGRSGSDSEGSWALGLIGSKVYRVLGFRVV